MSDSSSNSDTSDAEAEIEELVDLEDNVNESSEDDEVEGVPEKLKLDNKPIGLELSNDEKLEKGK